MQIKNKNSLTRKALYGMMLLGLILSTQGMSNIPATMQSVSPNNQNLPSVIDYSSEMPPVEDQGRQGSCTAWSIAYYYKSYLEKKKHNWEYSDAHLFSPSYIYNQSATSNDWGPSSAEYAFQTLASQGVSSLSTFPYNDLDYSTQPSQQAISEAANYKITGYQKLYDQNGLGTVESLKNYLATRGPFEMSIPVYGTGLDMLGPWNALIPIHVPTVIDIPSASAFEIIRGGHAVIVVGYDDATQRFKFINSWGTSWGENGFGYITYAFVLEQFPKEAWAITDTSDTANDDIATTNIISSLPYSNIQDTVLATTANDDPVISCSTNSGQYYNTVWYSYTPDSSQALKFDTFGSDYDTLLAIWTGERGSLVSAGCNDDASSPQSQIVFEATAGTTYYIEVASYYDGRSGSLTINATVSTNLLQDPSFEAYTPNPYWLEASTNWETPLCSLSNCSSNNGTAGPRIGSSWGWFGGTPNDETGSLSQTVTFPNSSAYLEFYLWIGSAEAGSDTADIFTAEIDGTPIFSANATEINTYSVYTFVSVNVSAYADGAAHIITFSSVTTGQSVDFNLDDVALLISPTTYSISGTILNQNNIPISGVTVSSGADKPPTTTDAFGNYILSGFIPGMYSIMPSKTGYTFNPIASVINIVNGNMTGTNFTGIETTYSISGTILAQDKSPISGVAVSSGANNSSTTTDSLGNYTLSGFVPGAYSITPSKAGYTFNPIVSVINIVDGNMSSVNFTGTQPTNPALTVTNTNDSGAGSLRNIIESAGIGDTIIFDTSLSGATIRLASALTLPNDVTINGSALALQITISGDTDNNGTGDVRVFYVDSEANVTLNSLIITKGRGGDGGGILNYGTLTITNSTLSRNFSSGFGYGGGIYNYGTLTIINSTFSGNSSGSGASKGGGIFNSGMLTVTNSTFSGNSAAACGGGISSLGGTMTVTNSTITGNYASSCGGGIDNSSMKLTLTNSTITGNSANNGGGIYSDSDMMAINSTFSGNYADKGGGIYNYGNITLTVINSTLSGNSANQGGGIYNGYSGTLNYANTIIANSSGGDCFSDGDSMIGYDTYNLVEDGSCTPTFSGDPNLGVLANNGGTTKTFALLTGSKAIDTGNDAICAAAPVNNTSQNGITRPRGTHCDIGSFELNVITPIFTDVPNSYWANSYIERLANAGITGGCGNGNYCPDNTVTRAQMAVFLLKGMHGSSFAPPTVGSNTGFTDVAINYWAAAWIKQLAAEGITGGCGDGNYCPDVTVTRAQMAIFLLKAKHGASYSPPHAAGVFTDVPVGYWADKWIEQLASEGITGGCGGGNYCPDSDVTRAQMAVFLVKAFSLP